MHHNNKIILKDFLLTTTSITSTYYILLRYFWAFCPWLMWIDPIYPCMHHWYLNHMNPTGSDGFDLQSTQSKMLENRKKSYEDRNLQYGKAYSVTPNISSRSWNWCSWLINSRLNVIGGGGHLEPRASSTGQIIYWVEADEDWTLSKCKKG